jgi:hypothetical protein
MMAERAIKVIDQIVIEQMQGKVDIEQNVWLIPAMSADSEPKQIEVGY